MAEESIVERRRIEKDAINAKKSIMLAGTFSTFGLALLALLAGVYCSLHGAQFAGGLIGGSGMLAVVVAGVLNLPKRGRIRRGDTNPNQPGNPV